MYTLVCIYDERGNVVEVMFMLWRFSLISDIQQLNTQTSTGRLVVAGPGRARSGRVGPDQVASGRAGLFF